MTEVTEAMIEAGEHAWMHRNLRDTASSPLRDAYLAMEAARSPVAPDDVVRQLGDKLDDMFGPIMQGNCGDTLDCPLTTERPWQPWERNFSGGRIGVQEQQGATENWMILHVESGGAKTTTSLRHHEAWDLALMLSPQLKARLEELFQGRKKAEAALYSLTYRGVDTDKLRAIADELDCGTDCDYGGGRGQCPKMERDGCDFADAESIRDLAAGIDLGNATVEADVLRAIDSCGGAPGPEGAEWSAGYNAVLDEVERLREALAAIMEVGGEINPSNYNHEDVRAQTTLSIVRG